MYFSSFSRKLAIPALIGCLLTAVAAGAAWWSDHARLASELDAAAAERARAVNSVISSELEFLNLIRIYFKTAADINEADFNYLARKMRAEHPTALGVAWLPLISHSEKQPFETKQRKTNPGFVIYEADERGGTRPVRQRNSYLPVAYMDSIEAIYQVGLDFGSQPRFLNALSRARDLGVTTTTNTLNAPRTAHFPVMLLAFAPVYEGSPATNQARRMALRGYFAAALQVNALMEAALAGFPSDYIKLELITRSEDGVASVLYGQNYTQKTAGAGTLHSTIRVLEKLPEHWEISVRPGAAFETSAPTYKAFVITALGLLATLLFVHHKNVVENRSGVIKDLVDQRTEQMKQTQQELEAHSRIDSLTGLYNRRHLDEEIEREWSRCVRNGGAIAIAIIDIDHFKLYNDFYGHVAGDKALRSVGNILAASFRRPGDLIARYGGEEFMAVLANIEGAENHLRKLVAAFEQVNIEHARSSTAAHLTISVGLALCEPKRGDSLRVAILQADRALYIAKNDGRNRVECWTQQEERLNQPILNDVSSPE